MKNKIVFFILTTAIILSLNLTPAILQYRHAPAGRTFGLIHNNVQDYYFYQALMNEGANGAWLTYDPYTTEPHQQSIIFSYFLWLGKLSKVFGLSYALTYHITRILLGALFLFIVYSCLFLIKIPYPRLTYLLFLFAAPFMHTINDYGTLRSVPFMSWWNGVDPIRRAAFLPHHMMGGLLLVISIIIIFKSMERPTRGALVRLILISAVMAFVHTPSLLILLLVLPAAIVVYHLINKQPKIPILSLLAGDASEGSQKELHRMESERSKRLEARPWDTRVTGPAFEKFGIKAASVGLTVYWLFGLFFSFVMILQTKSGFPWSQYIDWEKNLQFPLMQELIGALGILLPFSLLGIYHAIKSKKFENIFIVCWLVVPFLFIPIASTLNLSNIRLIQGVPYLPLSILAIFGIQEIVAGIKKLKNSLEYWSIGVLVFIFIIFTYPTLQWSLKDQIREYMPIYGNVYLDNRLFDAFKFINNNYPAKTITLCTFYCGNYLPAYTNTISFIGHFGYTYREEEKERQVQKFFKGEMSVDAAKNFLVSNKIILILQGPEEKPLYKDYLYPTLLKSVYDKGEITIYTPTL